MQMLPIQVHPLDDTMLGAMEEVRSEQWNLLLPRLKSVPGSWRSDAKVFPPFFSRFLQHNWGLGAFLEGRFVGYLVYDMCDFQGDYCALCPVFGHGAVGKNRVAVYQALLQRASENWVRGGSVNHLMSFFCSDPQLQEELYGLGFGLYMIDAFRGDSLLEEETFSTEVEIIPGTFEHLQVLKALGDAALEYSVQSPLFLLHHEENEGYYRRVLQDPEVGVFLARMEGKMVGFMMVCHVSCPEPATLCDTKTAALEPLGPFILPKFRNRGAGTLLLQACIRWARKKGLRSIHVDFESANTLCRPFWERFFQPALLTVRRHVNSDVLDVFSEPREA